MNRPDSETQAMTLQRLFGELVALSGKAREYRLRETASRNPELARKLAALLDADQSADDVLSSLHPFAEPPSTTPGMVPPGTDPPTTGSRITHYELLERIGAGGMGEVYKAWDLRLQRTVALKLLSADVGQDAKRKARFLQEARAASALDHPAICTIHEIGETPDGLMFITMACYEGENVFEQLKRGPLDLQDALRIVIPVAEGLDLAHQVGITHRDIKPANIAITADGQPKILDFGIAKMAGMNITGEGDGILGTVAYMSPEQIRGEDVDQRTDVWALGVVLYEMLAGRRPFAGEQQASVVYKIINERPDPLPDAISGRSVKTQRILDRALAKNRGQRYPSMTEFKADLEEAQDETGTVFGGAPAPVLAELPSELTSFVGREVEIDAVKALLGQARLVTLTGPAGTGKTRLSLRVASELGERYRHGTAFVPLDPITDPNMVADRIASTLGLPESHAQSAEVTLGHSLKDQDILIVLDNIEQVIEASGVLVSLLEACPSLRFLVTSRIALRVTGEQEYEIPPLEIPAGDSPVDLDTLEAFAATQLFVQRARAVRPGWVPDAGDAAAIREICARLDGLPLAIELAAARTKLLPPAAIVNRLGKRLDLLTGGPRDRPARQQTIREALGWSYNLLNNEEQAFFRRLGVFSGGFTLEAADAVCSGMAGCSIDATEGIDTLLNQSLLRRARVVTDQPRFMLLETMREFALEQLSKEKEEGVREIYAEFFLALAEEAQPELIGPDQASWSDRLEADHDNLLGVLTWAESSGKGELGLRLGSAIWRFWAIRGHLHDGSLRLQRLLMLPEARQPTSARARVLNALGTILHEVGRFVEAKGNLNESLEISREIGDREGAAVALNNLGWVAGMGEGAKALPLCEEGLKLNRDLGNKRGVATAIHNLSWVSHLMGQYANGAEYQEENLRLRREIGDERGFAYGLATRAWTEEARGLFSQAEASATESLENLKRIGERQIICFSQYVLCWVALRRGEHERLEQIYPRTLASWRQAGNQYGAAATQLLGIKNAIRVGDLDTAKMRLQEVPELQQGWRAYLHSELGFCRGNLAMAQGDQKEALRYYLDVLETSLELGLKWAVTRSFEKIGLDAARKDEWERFVCLNAQAEVLRKQTGAARSEPLETKLNEKKLEATLRLGDESFDQVYSEGRALTLELAAELARGRRDTQ